MINKIINILEESGVYCEYTIAIKLSISVEKAKSLVQIVKDQGLISETQQCTSCNSCKKC